MKKLMIAAAIVCVAAMSQAAAISWMVGPINGAGANGNGWGDTPFDAENCTYQFLVGSYTAGNPATLGEGYNIFNQYVAEMTIFDSANGMAMLYFDNVQLGVDAQSQPIMMKTDTPYWAQVIITDANGSTLTSGQYLIEAGAAAGGVAEPMFGTAEYVANVEAIPGVSALDETYGVFTSAGWQGGATPTPEPTSGLLLLLGVAGLALRRRRA